MYYFPLNSNKAPWLSIVLDHMMWTFIIYDNLFPEVSNGMVEETLLSFEAYIYMTICS